MAAPLANTITLPSDTGNAGKKVRTQTRVVGSDTVHEHFFIPSLGFTVLGKYFFSSIQQSVSATAQDGISTTQGFFWFQLPTAATATAIIRSIIIDANTSSTVVTPTAPVITCDKFSFTGTASAAGPGTVVPYQTAGTPNQMIARTNMTGMTVSLVGSIGQFAIPSILTGVGQVWAQKQILPRNPLSYQRGVDLEIGPGEGLVVRQSVAGTASDPRRFGIQVEWIEIDLT